MMFLPTKFNCQFLKCRDLNDWKSRHAYTFSVQGLGLSLNFWFGFLGQIVRRIYKGIPASVRGLVWARILSINKTREEQKDVYKVNRGNDSVILLCFIMKKYLI